MLKASELRIGNIVWESSSFTPGPDDFEQIVVGAINDIDKVVLDNQNNIYSYDYLYPIPLTVELMAKCGFSWDAKNNNYYIQVGNTFYLEYDTDFDCSVVPETWRGSSLRLWGDNRCLHQLQNLYFALTGEDLTIKN
jgi:hypothetical protein